MPLNRNTAYGALMLTTDLIYFDAAKAASIAGVERIAFSELESKLAALDLNQLAAGTESKPIHEKVKTATFVRASGWASIEDYDRYLLMANNSNAIIEFIGRCTIHAVEQSREYQKAQQELDNARQV